ALLLCSISSWQLSSSDEINSFYTRPASASTLKSYAEVLPPGFPCLSKVWDRVTAHSLSSPRDKERRGQRNPDWLNAGLFLNEVLGPMREHFESQLGPLIFEFQAIPKKEKIGPAEFAAHLDKFFAALPTDVRYAIEIRNEDFLSEQYFAVLRE